MDFRLLSVNPLTKPTDPRGRVSRSISVSLSLKGLPILTKPPFLGRCGCVLSVLPVAPESWIEKPQGHGRSNRSLGGSVKFGIAVVANRQRSALRMLKLMADDMTVVLQHSKGLFNSGNGLQPTPLFAVDLADCEPT
jgi:hypothetical protein